MSKFTPGPWINCNTHVDDSRGVPLFRSTRSFDELNPYDFRLAAAAPALYTACKAALEFLHDCPEEEALMKSALALADGETK